jgi:hypothetical protein
VRELQRALVRWIGTCPLCHPSRRNKATLGHDSLSPYTPPGHTVVGICGIRATQPP